MAENRNYYQFQRAEMMEFLPHSYKRVLEIGCGEGSFAAQLLSNTEIWGVEPNETAARAAANRLKTVLIGNYDTVRDRLPASYFDLVICNDVIEHVPDHDALLRDLHNKLQDGGYLVASIPNVRHFKNLAELLFQKDWRYREAGVLDRTHLRFFTERSIRRTLVEHGFVIDVLKGINRPRSSRKRILTSIIKLLTFGFYADIQYQQLGIRARKE